VSTGEIVASRALERQCGEDCIDWALSMLVDGHDSRHLRMLAGRVEPHNHFELAALRDRALEELGEKPVSFGQALRLFAKERLRLAIAGTADLPAEVARVANLCVADDYARDLYDFYLLHDAYTDLAHDDQAWTWPGANRSNILQIMKSRAEEFLRTAEPA
jgi:hypothetical protein